ncbi:MAG TPA: hypothetical protein VKS79_26640 [Gemmataceae bacterium]|nr:hypothetical protein [Gemmataceae bacterium]
MNRFGSALCVLSLLVFSTAGWAGDLPPQRDDAAIVKVVADSNEAAKKGDWQRYADFVDPQSLADYKKMWQPALTAAAKQGPDQQAELLKLFDNAADLKSIMALKPREFLAASMKGMAAQFKQGPVNPQNADHKVIGVVHDGEDQAYVVVRMSQKFGTAEMTKVDVVGVKRSGAEWRMELPDVVRTLAETMGRILPNVEKADRATIPDVPKK